MSDMYDDDSTEDQLCPDDLCRQAFSRSANWPEDRLGQIGLAQGLAQASKQFRISKEDLIQRCREISAFCPTDADLLRVAGEMFRTRQDALLANKKQLREWEKRYGPPRPYDTSQKGKCLCCGREWEEIIRTSQERKTAMWNSLRAHFGVKNGKWPPYRDMAPVARALGYKDYADAWERS
jgi:hypothetical protein